MAHVSFEYRQKIKFQFPVHLPLLLALFTGCTTKTISGKVNGKTQYKLALFVQNFAFRLTLIFRKAEIINNENDNAARNESETKQ